jgi:hypothetical protein
MKQSYPVDAECLACDDCEWCAHGPKAAPCATFKSIPELARGTPRIVARAKRWPTPQQKITRLF